MASIYSGSQIKQLKERHQKLTRTQTAAQAVATIVAKYGEISASDRYYHIGKGVWKKYSLENDRKRTGKIATTREERDNKPHKFDWPGVDTKAASKKVKRSFSVSMLKAPGEMKGRQGKSAITAPLNRTLPFKTFSGLYKDVAYTVNADTRLISFKWDFSQHKGYYNLPPVSMRKLKDVELNMFAVSKQDAITHAKKSIDIFHRGVGNIFSAQNRNLSVKEVAEATKSRKPKSMKSQKFSAGMLKQGKLSGRKNKSALKLIGNHVLKHMPKMKAVVVGKSLDDLQAQRLDLLLNMEYVAPTNDPLHKYMHYETELIRTFPSKQEYKQWREKNLEIIKKKGLLQKFKNIKTIGAQGKRKVTIREMPVIKGHVDPVKAEVHKQSTLKEINIRLDELKKIYEPVFRADRHPTVDEAKAIKEANTLIKKRDGILKRKETMEAKGNTARTKRKAKTSKESANSKIFNEGLALEEKFQNSLVDAQIKQEFNKNKEHKNTQDSQAKIKEWALTSAAQAITPKASFLVYDFITGRYENTLKDIERGKVTKQQVYRILGKIGKFKALPKSVISNYTKKIRDFKPAASVQASIPKSKNHIMFVGDFEIYQRGQNGDVYASRKNNYIDTFGYRADSRFLCTKAFWDIPKNKKYYVDGFKPEGAKKFSLSQLKPPSKPSKRTEKTVPRASKKPSIKTVSAAGKYRYASFNRPLWAGFNPGVQYKLENVLSSDRDFRYNRAPHSVISTNTKLSEDILKKFELTDLTEGKKMQELINHVDKFDFLTDNMKGQLKDLILEGRSKEEVDKYIEKGKKMAEKK